MDLYEETTALLVVDVESDFADPGGSLYVIGADEIVPAVNREIRKARSQGALNYRRQAGPRPGQATQKRAEGMASRRSNGIDVPHPSHAP